MSLLGFCRKGKHTEWGRETPSSLRMTFEAGWCYQVFNAEEILRQDVARQHLAVSGAT